MKRAAYGILLLSALLSVPLITAAPGISPFSSKWARIETECTGLTADKVENMVTDHLSERVLSLPQVLDVYSSSTAEKSLLLLRTPWYLKRDELMSQLLKAVERVRPRLPEAAHEPKVSYIENSSPPILMGITPVDGEVSGRVQDHPQTIAHTLRRLPLFSEVEIYGLSEEEVHIDLDPYLLGPSSLTFAGTLNTISSSLFHFTAGGTVENNISIPVEISGGVDSLEKLSTLPLDEAGGHTPLSEIADISSTHKREHEIRVNEERALVVSLTPGEGGKVPLLTTLFHLMEPEKPITGAFPGWRVSVLANPYRTLVRSALSTAALVSLACTASLLFAVQYRAASFRAHTFKESLCLALFAASVIPSLVFALYPLSAAPGRSPSPGRYRHFFLIEENSLAEFLQKSAGDIPKETEMWSFPASLPGYSTHSGLFPSSPSLPVAAGLVEEDITSLFIRTSSVAELLSILRSHGFAPVPAASPVVEIPESRGPPSGKKGEGLSLADQWEERLTIIPRRRSLPKDMPGSGGIDEIMEAAFEGIFLGTMEPRRRRAPADGTSGAASADSLFSARRANTPVYLFYGRDHLQGGTSHGFSHDTFHGISSFPTALSRAVASLGEITEITGSLESRRILSLNGSPLRYRFSRREAENTRPEEQKKEQPEELPRE